jgi:HEAT repeat protein
VTATPAKRPMAMTRRVTVIIVALIAAACQRHEPMAGGKPLSHWKKEATQVDWLSFWSSGKGDRRRTAFGHLSEIGEPAIPALVDLVRKHDGPVRSGALDVLAKMGPRATSAIPELIEMLNDGPTDLRLHVAWALGRIGPSAEPAVPSLTPLLRHPDPKLRYAAAQALAQIGGSGHVALEESRTKGDVRQRSASMQGMAARSLDAALRREIVAAGLDDPSPEVRLRAVELLMTVGGEDREALAPYLMRALNDSDPAVNRMAHTVLTVYQDNGASPRLLAAVLKGGDAAARADAAWHLGHLTSGRRYSTSVPTDPVVVDALLAALNDPDPKVRIYAGRALAHEDGAPRAKGIQRLRRDMRNVEPILGVRAARVLWEVARDLAEVRPVYEAGLSNPGKWNRMETIAAIADLGKDAETFASQLERLLNDPDPEVRDRAEKVLHMIMVRRAR